MGRHKNHVGYKRYHIGEHTRTELPLGRLPDDEYAAMASVHHSGRRIEEVRKTERERRAEYVRAEREIASDVIRRQN